MEGSDCVITLDKSRIVIENLVQIVVLEDNRVRCLLNDLVIELFGSHFHVHSLSDRELVLHGKIKAVELHER